MRPSGRAVDQKRTLTFHRHFTQHAEGSVLVCLGNTQVLCTVSVEKGVPRWLKGKNQGWLTAEYGMLPRATHTRTHREAVRGKQTGRSLEIQRLIGRSLRAALDLKQLGDYTLLLDCDVLQADGGTRTASISGACVALVDALRSLQRQKCLKTDPFKQYIAAVSVGIYKGEPLLDLDYAEDAHCDTDMNVVMTEQGRFIEVQGTAEGMAFSSTEMLAMMALAETGCQQIIASQKKALEAP